MSMSEEVITTSNANDVNFTNMQIDDEELDDVEGDDEGGEDEEQTPRVKLGFVEKKPKHEWSIVNNKAGGIPAWLDPINLPSGKSCMCDICGEPLQFLLQIYDPLSDDKLESTYHRSLFVFMCTSMSCLLQHQHEQWKTKDSRRSIKVFRCQLPGHNQFYSSDSNKPLGTAAAPLCTWCGTWKGDKVCSKCKRAGYCSKTHQAVHWRSIHKMECSRPTEQLSNSIPEAAAASNDNWPEYEIIIKYKSSDFDKSNNNTDGSSDNEDEDGDAKSWAYFIQTIASHPTQVLRCSGRDSLTCEPLWPMLSGRPSKVDIPKCSCGGHRVFEFQILPQLLYYFEVKNDSNSLDWATIVVYTCEASCDDTSNGSQSPYQEEFSWVQLSSQSR